MTLKKNNRFDFNVPTLIIGMGDTGVSCARFLKKKNSNFSFADTRNEPPFIEQIKNEFAQVDCILGEFNIDVLMQYKQLIVSPGISIRTDLFAQLKKNGCYILGDIELFSQLVDKPVIAITGSNGKTTVTTLVEKIASQCGLKTIACGNIGVPVLDCLEMDYDLYVLELSSFQLETTQSLQTLSATVLNVSEDHMDRYDNLVEYRKVKETVYHLTDNPVVNRNETNIINHVFAEQSDKGDSILSFGQIQPAELSGIKENDYSLMPVNNEFVLMKGQQKIVASSELKITSGFNYLNILAALALLEPLQLNEEKMIKAIKDFTGLAHRCEWVVKMNEIQFYNDSKGTNTGATIAAIDGFDNGKSKKTTILIAGGVGKNADFTAIGEVIKKKIKSTVLMGIDAGLIRDCALSAGAENDSLYLVDSMQDAVMTAYQLAEPGDVVLFSPACASFDMYQNYQQRGDDFKEKVNHLVIAGSHKECASIQNTMFGQLHEAYFNCRRIK